MLKAILLLPLFNLLLLIYAYLPGHDFGVSVLVLTVLIRVLLWPLVKKQLHHQKAMRDLQPAIAKIKAKTKGDKARESQQMMELFKEKEINPFSSFGLVLLQFPVLIALFFVLQRVLDPAQVREMAYTFVHNLAPVQAIIAHPDQFHPSLLGLVDMTKPNILLALLAGLTQFWQTKQLMPADLTKTGSKKAFGFNMTMIFPVLTVAIAARFPAALALYWAATSLVGVLQQTIVLNEDVALMQRFKWVSKNGQRD